MADGARSSTQTDSASFVLDGHPIAAPSLDPGLYVVATPIGNLGDITIRALMTLAAADVVACEDSRITARLLDRYGIDTPRTAYHEHNARRAAPALLARLDAGEAVALASDAGTPLISDPGYRLVQLARTAGHRVTPVPGPSAVMAALSAGGLPTDRFLFAGFLPSRPGQRRSALAGLARSSATLVLFESPNRLAAALADIAAELGADRQVRVCRELTKLHEEIDAGTAGELAERWGDRRARGEVVLLVEGRREAPDADEAEAVLRECLATMSVSRAAAQAAEITGLPKRDLYAMALRLAGEAGSTAGKE